MPANIDQLTPIRSLIDLSSHSDGNFGMEDFILSQVYNDIILVEFIDLSEDGENVKRGSIFIPTNTLIKAWRKAKVVLVGTEVKKVTESGENAVSADTTKLKSDKCHSPCDALKYNDADGSFTSNLN